MTAGPIANTQLLSQLLQITAIKNLSVPVEASDLKSCKFSSSVYCKQHVKMHRTPDRHVKIKSKDLSRESCRLEIYRSLTTLRKEEIRVNRFHVAPYRFFFFRALIYEYEKQRGVCFFFCFLLHSQAPSMSQTNVYSCPRRCTGDVEV